MQQKENRVKEQVAIERGTRQRYERDRETDLVGALHKLGGCPEIRGEVQVGARGGIIGGLGCQGTRKKSQKKNSVSREERETKTSKTRNESYSHSSEDCRK